MADSDASQPLVVGIGGTIGGTSSPERAHRIALAAAGRNSQVTKCDDAGGASDAAVVVHLCMVGRQVARFAPLAASMAPSPVKNDARSRPPPRSGSERRRPRRRAALG